MFARSWIVVSLICAGALAAQEDSGRIAGQVVDSEGAPIPGANVVLTGEILVERMGTTTDADGAYMVEGVPTGQVSITVSHIGFSESTAAGVKVTASATTTRDFVLSSRLIFLDQSVVSASRRTEKILDAPASVAVVEASEIQNQPVLSLAEHVRDLPGVDVSRTGLVQNNMVVRGFNNIFSGALLTLSDNRIARVPSLRVNVYNFIPATSDDIERIEVVLGPGSALYGPNSANGVMHVITKSPLTSVGTSAQVGFGERSLRKYSVRHAGKASEELGYKISAEYYTGKDWESQDASEQAARAADPSLRPRDFDVSRRSAEVRVDYRPNDQLQAIFSAGTNEGDHIELTGLGAGQIIGFGTNYAQARLLYNNWFGQVYRNWSSAGDTYLLATGIEIADRSSLTVMQLQHDATLGDRQRFTYGVDALFTRPDTERTIYGENEDNDSIDEIGAYLQSETTLTPELDLVLALRYDDHSRLEEEEFSPRAGLVYKPREDQTLRLTYNRAFSTPTALTLYLDLVSRQDPFGLEPNFGPVFAASGLEFEPIDLRVQGTYNVETNGGFTFSRDDDGRPRFRSPFAPLAGGSPTSQFIDMDSPIFTNVMWGIGRQATIAGFQAQAEVGIAQQLRDAGMGEEDAAATAEAQAAGLANALGIIPAQLEGLTNIMMGLNLEKVAAEDPAPFDSVSEVIDVPRTKSTITQTYELGYKGVVGKKLVVAADLYRTRTEDFVGPLRIETPNVFLDPVTLAGALGPAIAQELGDAANEAQAGALAALDLAAFGGDGDGSVVTELTNMFTAGAAQIPYGTVSPEQAYDNTAVILTYRNFDEAVTVNGLDLALSYFPNDTWSVNGAYSFVDDDLFENLGGVGDIALNAPKHKFKLGATYNMPRRGLVFTGQLRYSDSFPMQSGVFEGKVDSYKVLDLGVSYALPVEQDLRLQIEVDNVLDNGHEEFVGGAKLGRLLYTQLGVRF